MSDEIYYFKGISFFLFSGTSGYGVMKFYVSIFSIKQLLVLVDMLRNDYEFYRIFMELFVFVNESALDSSPGSCSKSF